MTPVTVADPPGADARAAAAVDLPLPAPRFIGDPARPVFTWHHAPPAHARREQAVVLCPPLGHEYLSAYRTWRVLAERLAALGFDVVRLEYDGTGSSAGEFEDPARLDAWLASIATAISDARALAGSSSVALVGLRIGALLALRAAAADGGVERVVAWSPCASGRALVRELRVFAGLAVERGAREDADPTSINAAGYILRRETIDALSGWTPGDLATRPASDVLVIDHDGRSVDERLAARLETLGSRVGRVRLPGTVAMLVPPQHAVVPAAIVDEIAGWIDAWRPARSTRRLAESGQARQGRTRARGDGWCERAVRFGPGGRLFGLLTTPAAGPPTRPSVVLFNTGVEFQAGFHRLYVPLARRWAARGHAVLRFDLGGLGDSPAPEGAPEDEAYPAHMVDDAREAIALLRAEAPAECVLLAGFCSGGLVSFRAACAGLPVAAIACVNTPVQLRDGEAGRQRLRDARELARYGLSLRDPARWLKALSGGASYRTLARLAAGATRGRLARAAGGRFGAPLPDGLAADLDRFARRGIRCLFVFSPSEEALPYFERHAASAFRRDHVRRLVSRVIVEGAGHTFRPHAAQQALRALLDEFVTAPRP